MKTSINPSVIQQFLSSRIHNRQENYIHPPYEMELKLTDAITMGNDELAHAILKEINQLEGATLAANPIRSRKNALIAVCTLFTRAIIKGGVDPETAFHLSDAYIMELEKTNDLDRLNQMEYEMLAHFIKTQHEESSSNTYSHPVNLAISYIYENILEELSLEVIASRIYVHPNYLSSRFKKETGLTITEFINKKRIEESKYFLLHTNTSISGISFLFKFCNQSYYTALFKKLNGITPREFRQLKQTV
ncbi:helix-turn-helix transcriptional regulator [Bacillus marinisedimentorum]|uniref:helix-turn-helix transcriptional regulator n=1 Tax=Bacillus marinisedimentorum TaxID=1821260 RepID=UPI0008732D1F|nr:AraC family transcriptional regulator [Bacillus marinisedimentorum]